jgi:hypothetical protein
VTRHRWECGQGYHFGRPAVLPVSHSFTEGNFVARGKPMAAAKTGSLHRAMRESVIAAFGRLARRPTRCGIAEAGWIGSEGGD